MPRIGSSAEVFAQVNRDADRDAERRRKRVVVDSISNGGIRLPDLDRSFETQAELLRDVQRGLEAELDAAEAARARAARAARKR